MIIQELKLKGLLEIIPEPVYDFRGYFMRVFDHDLFKKYGIDIKWVHENQSRTERAGTIRGLHFQKHPFEETKLIRCISGAILDVAVDIRKGSDTFGQWAGVEISETNRKMLLIPRGFAHGFCALTEGCEVLYKVDNYYSPENERGLIWNDPDLNIDWPVKNPILSAKDQENLTLKRFIEQGEHGTDR